MSLSSPGTRIQGGSFAELYLSDLSIYCILFMILYGCSKRVSLRPNAPCLYIGEQYTVCTTHIHTLTQAFLIWLAPQPPTRAPFGRVSVRDKLQINADESINAVNDKSRAGKCLHINSAIHRLYLKNCVCANFGRRGSNTINTPGHTNTQ